MWNKPTVSACVYWAAFLLTCVGAAVLLWHTPTDPALQAGQWLFYIHMPAAVAAYAACTVAFVAGVGCLWRHGEGWDAVSASAARTAALLCTLMMVTGMAWSRLAWGRWWFWTPRLTFSLLLWLLYVGYVIIRPSIESPRKRATVCAGYVVMAFLDAPLVYLSVRLMPDIHPVDTALVASTQLTLAACFVPVTLLTAGLIVTGSRRAIRAAKSLVGQTAALDPASGNQRRQAG